MSFSAVEPKCREMIAKHQLFELYHLHKADDVEFTEQRGLMSFNCWIHCTGVGSTHPPGEEDTTKDSDLQGCTYHWLVDSSELILVNMAKHRQNRSF